MTLTVKCSPNFPVKHDSVAVPAYVVADSMTATRMTRAAITGLIFLAIVNQTEPECAGSCDLALASYYVWKGSNLTLIATALQSSIITPNDDGFNTILSYNKQLTNKDFILEGDRINVPFPCGCIDNNFLGHVFRYSIHVNDSYDKISALYYSHLTTVPWLERFNVYNATDMPSTGMVNVTVNCSCGDIDVSDDYGLFITYPLRSGENLTSIAQDNNIDEKLLRRYNVGVNFSQEGALIYVPGKDARGSYLPLKHSTGGITSRVIGTVFVAAVAVVGLFVIFFFVGWRRRKKMLEAKFMSEGCQELSSQTGHDSISPRSSLQLAHITIDRSVEFSYHELSNATDDFSMSNMIGEGGYGSVYYAELRGEKAAIKRMDMRFSKEFVAELKVLTHVHHVNLVRLIGYCVEGFLFLVYEYIENGNLSYHLRGSGVDTLPWSTRVQIAMESARGLEYIHEHTVPVYIHRDIKSANILIDKNFHAKVADFGLTKLAEVGGASLPTRLVGTFGYMPPEYAQYGDVSPKVDVYAFGVVLYELISAKDAIVKPNTQASEAKGLVALFEDVLGQSNASEGIQKLVDPKMQDRYPVNSVMKMAHLARACTSENPQSRPTMRHVVVALTPLSSEIDNWGASFDEVHGSADLTISGR